MMLVAVMLIVVMRTVIGLIVAVMLIVVVMLKVKVSEVVGLQGNTYEERLVELGMDTLEERRQDQDLVQVFKILKNVDSVNKETWFKQVPEERSHKTRATEGGHNIVRVNSKLEVRRNFFSQRVAEKWNALPLNLKSCKSVKEFRALLMKTQHQ